MFVIFAEMQLEIEINGQLRIYHPFSIPADLISIPKKRLIRNDNQVTMGRGFAHGQQSTPPRPLNPLQLYSAFTEYSNSGFMHLRGYNVEEPNNHGLKT